MHSINSLRIKNIQQVDNHSFGVEWNDGIVSFCRLSVMQKKCPCAGCANRGQDLVVDENVKAVSIKGVGNYAIAVRFSSGCSAGIYDYALLRSICEGKQ
jgi:DUF971 family protein